MPAPKIFISHSHEDDEWVRELAKALERHGFAVWLDELQIRAGDSIPDAIEDGLRSSDILVVLVNDKTAKRPNLFFELGAAIGMGKRVIPIVPNDLNPALLPHSIRSRKFMLKGSPDETADELVSEIALVPAHRAA